MSLGFHNLGITSKGFKLVGGIDIDENSLATYSLNFNVPTVQADIRDIAESDGTYNRVLLNLINTDMNLPIVLIGCAPCQGFSGHRKYRWNTPDNRNELIVAFAQIVTKLLPDYVVMENVPDMLSSKYYEYFQSCKSILESASYTVDCTILNAAEFGVPQERSRAIVVAYRNGRFAMPTGLVNQSNYRTVRDAIGDLPMYSPGDSFESDPMHCSANHRSSTIEVIKAVPKDGGNRPSGVGPKSLEKIKGYYDVYGRLHWDRPSITVTNYARNPASGRFVHPEQDRGLTKREVARLQSFPDSFKFCGTFDDIFRQIGEAVPPRLSTAIASSILESIRNECTDP